MKVCISAPNILRYPQGGHLWVFLNWAYGFKDNGCEVHLLDILEPCTTKDEQHALVSELRGKIPFPVVVGLKDSGTPKGSSIAPMEEYDLLLDMRYDTPEDSLSQARVKALLDIDPGQLQAAISSGIYPMPTHDALLSIGDIPEWTYIPPVVAIEQWPVVATQINTWTTIGHWWGDNSAKRDAFQEYMTIPFRTGQHITLALPYLTSEELARIQSHGFSVVDAHQVANTPDQYREFIQNSAGEFSAAKKWYVEHPTGWLSDRTLCYMASGKPCIVQHTGQIRCMNRECDFGLLRFSTLDEAVDAFKRVKDSYDDHCQAARHLCETHFSAEKICADLLNMLGF